MCWWSLRLGLMMMGSSQFRWGVRGDEFLGEGVEGWHVGTEFLVWVSGGVMVS